MPPSKNLQYTIINESFYNGQGHIINIAKRHTNRRWRQYTPQKQCNIKLELVKTSTIQSIELKGFGTYLVQISFKDPSNKLVTKILYNFKFEDEAIKEDVICENQSGIKYVDVKLINDTQSPRRMGINHFFMRGKTLKKEGQQDNDSDEEKKKKRKKGAPNQVWVRQKGQDGDPWGLDQVSQDQEPQWKLKGSELIKNYEKSKNKMKNSQKQNKEKKLSVNGQKSKSEKYEQTSVKRQLTAGHMTTTNDDKLTQISKGRKKTKPDQKIEEVKLWLSKTNQNSQTMEEFVKNSKKFEKQFNLSKQIEDDKKEIILQETEKERKQKQQRIKKELIEKLRAKVKLGTVVNNDLKKI